MTQSPVRICLSLGSNLGDRQRNLHRAIEQLDRHPGLHLLMLSSLFHSEALLDPSLKPFVNAAALFECSLSPESLLQEIHRIETLFGRRRGDSSTRSLTMYEKPPVVPADTRTYSDRYIDIDIIFYGELEIQRPGLQIPHPDFAKRKFVLYPLRQIALNYEMPMLRGQIEQLIRDCPDHSEPQEI